MTSEELAERFKRMVGGKQWPLVAERALRRDVEIYEAIRESDRSVLRRVMPQWSNRADRTLIVDPLGEKIANAFADLIFGEDPVFEAKADADQGRLDALIEGSALIGDNAVAAELWGAERLCVSEGDVWWRIVRDYDVGHPVIEWHSRRDVVPLFIGKMLVAVAFVSRLDPKADNEVRGDGEGSTAWRHFELQTKGRVDNFLYRGTDDRVGSEHELREHPETADLDEVWTHGLPGMLAGRIPNIVGRRKIGTSQFQGIRDFLFSLNEAATIGHENARLTLKRRVVVTPSALERRGGDSYGTDTVRENPAPPSFDGSEEALIASGLDPDSRDPFRVLEYSFDADALIKWQTHLAKVCLTRADVAPQLVGYEEGGFAESGEAMKKRMLNSVNAAEGKARPWDSQVPMILSLCAMLESLPVDDGGFGRPWTAPGEFASMERPDPLPESQAEGADRHAVLVDHKIEARKTAIEALHPDWDEARVTEELDSIREDESSSMPSIPTFDPRAGARFGNGTGPPEGDAPGPADAEEAPVAGQAR